jgi:hypothetical protein
VGTALSLVTAVAWHWLCVGTALSLVTTVASHWLCVGTALPAGHHGVIAGLAGLDAETRHDRLTCRRRGGHVSA